MCGEYSSPVRPERLAEVALSGVQVIGGDKLGRKMTNDWVLNVANVLVSYLLAIILTDISS